MSSISAFHPNRRENVGWLYISWFGRDHHLAGDGRCHYGKSDHPGQFDGGFRRSGNGCGHRAEKSGKELWGQWRRLPSQKRGDFRPLQNLSRG
jgi:hypothetical protein